MATFKTKTAAEFRDDFLRSVSNSLTLIGGISNPQVGYGTDHYIIGEAIGKIAEMASYNAIAAADAQMADTAVGEDLYRIAAIYGLSLRSAGSSFGYVKLESTFSPIGIITGMQLIDPNGLKYQVSSGGSFSDGDLIPIISIDTGVGCNIKEGTLMKWVSPPAYVNPTCKITTGGMTGAVDAENDEGLRTRIYDRLRDPPGGGNAAQLNAKAEESTTFVEKSFCYPAFNGPSTVYVAVQTAPTTTNKSREIDPLIVDGTITANVYSSVFEGMSLTVKSVVDCPTEVSIGLALPTSLSASPPGKGGGWLDGTPFPQYVANGFSQVVSVANTTKFTVQSNFAPVAKLSKIVYIDKEWNKIHCTVQSYNVISLELFEIVVDKPCVGITVNDHIFPDAVLMDTYIDGLLDSFAGLGAGELITNIPGLLPFSYRRPYVQDSWTPDLGPNVLKNINSLPNVFDSDWFYRSFVKPPLPTNVMNGPYILVPKPSRISFYPKK